MRMKTASFTVRATMAQSVRWKRAAEAEGHASVGTWLAEALDRYLDALKRAGKPLALAWGRGRFRVRLEDGTEPEMRGWIARPPGSTTARRPGRFRTARRSTTRWSICPTADPWRRSARSGTARLWLASWRGCGCVGVAGSRRRTPGRWSSGYGGKTYRQGTGGGAPLPRYPAVAW